MSEGGSAGGEASQAGSLLRVLFWVFIGVLALGKVWAVFHQNVNWDEFALLQRAVASARSGVLEGGGRPGLATLVLIPFAEGCRNAVDALVQARMLWAGFVFAAGAVYWFLLRAALPGVSDAWQGAALGLALWVMVPVFLVSSTQVRTDQPALLFALLAGLALVHSRRLPALALAAGVLAGVGFLFSQKAVYVAGLVGILAVADLLFRHEFRGKREFVRVGLVLVGGVGTLFAFRAMVAATGGSPTIVPGSGQLGTFDFYRQMVGWREYRQMLPLLAPHLLALATLLAVSLSWILGRREHGRELVAAWAVCLAGALVLAFHAGRFSYFHMTAGLFPATVGALVIGPALARLRGFVPRASLLVVFWAPLVAGAILTTFLTMRPGQTHQREAIAFVDRSFDPEARGYDAVGVLACRLDPDPFPVRFAEHVWAEYGGPNREARAMALIEAFRAREVAFMMLPLEHESYPQTVRDFWDARYLPYHGAVRVPGREVRGGAGWAGSFEVIAPGEYRWMTDGGSPSLLVNGRVLQPGERVMLSSTGRVDLTLPDGGAGWFVIALDEPPTPESEPFFQGF